MRTKKGIIITLRFRFYCMIKQLNLCFENQFESKRYLTKIDKTKAIAKFISIH